MSALRNRALIGGVFALGVAAGIGAGLRIADTRSPTRPALPNLPPLPGLGAPVEGGGAPFREYPIGEAEQNFLRVSAVWLPPVKLEGEDDALAGDHIIHLEADVAALRGNPNGFGLGEWIPYLTITYRLTDPAGKQLLTGRLAPMVAADGPHYGATIPMPGPGSYLLTYEIQPPSAAGFGRHCDPVTGVGEWWPAFEVRFPWEYRP